VGNISFVPLPTPSIESVFPALKRWAIVGSSMPASYRSISITTLRLWPWFAAIVSGALCAACFPPFNQGWLCWIALTPLIAAAWFSGENSRRRWLRNLLLGYVAGVAFFTISFGWLGALGDLYANLFLHSLSLLLSIYLALYFAFWSWFIGNVKPRTFVGSGRNLLGAFLGAAAWTSQEWIRGWLFSGFGWNGLGVALHHNWPLIQVAEFTGVLGLSFAVAFSNVIAIAVPIRLFAETKTRLMRPHFDLTLTMIGVVALFAFGVHKVRNAGPTASIRIAAVQANVPQLEKFDPQFTTEIFDKFSRLSEMAIHTDTAPDLVVWPESSMPDPVRDPNSRSYGFIRKFCASIKSDLLVGTLDFEGEHDYNAAVLVSNGGERMQVYRKVHLVPFGEYIPARKSFPLFAAIAGTWVPGDFTSGGDFTTFRLTNGEAQIAPLICFEDTVGELVRQFVSRGANLLVDVTNDGWFLRSSGSEQHVANALFRCAELNRPMVRAANTGVTCFIDQFGRVTEVLRDDNGSTFTEGVLTGIVDIPQDRQLTFYARHGELFAKLSAVVTLLSVVWFFARILSRGGSPGPAAAATSP
jgi:apolipoprotein N-acyltransferase